MKRLAVLISNAGIGSNLRAIVEAIKSGELDARIEVVVCDQEDAAGLKIARENNIPTKVVKPQDDLLRILQEKNIDYVCLTGWKQIIPDEMINQFKIINIHPGLIPDSLEDKVKNPDGTTGLWNRGKFTTVAIQNFLDQKATYAGSSVHFLSKEFDFGEVLERAFVKIEPNDNILSLYKRLKVKENKAIVKALMKLCN